MKYLTLLFLFSATAFSQTFFERIRSNAEYINFKELKEIVKLSAEEKTPSYLSLGETHAQSQSTHEIAFELMKTFKNNIPKRYRSKICLEELPRLLTNTYFKDLSSEFTQKSVYEYNGPYKTDFSKCSDKKIKKYVTYSGFYHMLDFGQTFPGEIEAPGLQSKPNNFINLQMTNKKSLFIPQINLYVIEVLSTLKIFNEKILLASNLKSRLKNALIGRENLINQFEYLYLGTNIYENKMGITVNAQDIIGNKIKKPTYFLLTDLEYRIHKDYSFPLLKNLVKRTDKEIELFLKATRTYPVFLPPSGATFDETANNIPNICYGAYTDFCFPYHAQFLELKKADEYNLYVAVGEELKCFSRKLGFIETTNNEGVIVKKSYPFISQNCSEQIQKYDQ